MPESTMYTAWHARVMQISSGADTTAHTARLLTIDAAARLAVLVQPVPRTIKVVDAVEVPRRLRLLHHGRRVHCAVAAATVGVALASVDDGVVDDPATLLQHSAQPRPAIQRVHRLVLLHQQHDVQLADRIRCLRGQSRRHAHDRAAEPRADVRDEAWSRRVRVAIRQRVLDCVHGSRRRPWL
jgi:hypothetical protein